MSRMSGDRIVVTTWDPPVSNASTASVDVTVQGAKLGDFAFASLDSWTTTTAGQCVFSAAVSAANTVTVQLRGDSNNPNVASGTLRVRVVPYGAI